MANIPGVDELRSIRVSRSRSVPPHMNQPYIDMFMLRKEIERLETEGARLNTRIESIVGRLKEIEKEMKRLEREDRKAQRKRKFDWNKVWMQMRDQANPEEPEKMKKETGWKIKTLKGKKR
jgi:predicted nuclease with TOPRIM domain